MKQIAAIISIYRKGSHADVMIGKWLRAFPTDDGLLPPRTQIASIYLDQVFDDDMGVEIAAAFGVPVYQSIPGALCLGGKELAVDGVLLIGEHGDYPFNEKQQQLYPRRHFMEQITGVMASSGRSVPVYNDKHLSWRWEDAKWMADRAAELQAPFMAGSSLPVGWRSPFLEHDLETPLQEAVAVGFSGLDIYGFHTLEVLQCMVERRLGGESGVKAVTCMEGKAVWGLAKQGAWWQELAIAACAPVETKPEGAMQDHCDNPALFLLEYCDGFRGAVLMLNGYLTELSYAARNADDTVDATWFRLQGHGGEPGAYAHFSYLSLNVEEMFLTGQPQYPVERTLLTSGILEAALTSRHQDHTRIETPWLELSYQSYDELKWRPTGPEPSGACLQVSGPVSITGFADEIASAAGEQVAGLQVARVSHIEVRGVNGTNVLDLSDDEVDTFKGQLDEAGITVSCIGSPIGKVQIRVDLEEHFRRFQVALRRADQFDCRFVRLFSFYHEGEEADAIRERVVVQFRRMAAAAADAGVTLVHENEKDIYGNTPERCVDLLAAVDHPHLRAAFDPANFVQCGASPLQAWGLLAQHVVYFHIKDAIAESGRVVPSGLGDGQLEAILEAALDGGYSGFLSIEPHLKEDDPDYGGVGVERFTLATTALRAILHRLGAAEAG